MGFGSFFGFPVKYGAFVEEKTKRKEVTCKLCLKVLSIVLTLLTCVYT